MDLTDDLIKQVSAKCLEYGRSPHYQQQLENVFLAPIIGYLSQRIYPYFIGIVILLTINILCLVLAIYLFTRKPTA